MHAWGLALNDFSPVSERPEAWEFGPIFSTLYNELRVHGGSGIKEYVLDLNPATGRREPLVPDPKESDFWNLFEQVWKRYSPLQDTHLSTLSHQDRSPWDIARQGKLQTLDDRLVAEHYRRALKKSSESTKPARSHLRLV